jgi:hypothetical protein
MKKLLPVIIGLMILSSCALDQKTADIQNTLKTDSFQGAYAAQPAQLAQVSLIQQQTVDLRTVSDYWTGAVTRYVNRKFDILVKNTGYQKKVSIFYQTASNPAVWQEIPAAYKSSLTTDWEIWSINEIDVVYPDTRTADPLYFISGTYKGDFVVKYQVNGQTYWDNNLNRNYKIGLVKNDYKNVVGDVKLGVNFNVRLNTAGPDQNNPGSFSGGIYIRNLAYAKKVNVRYTTDGWKTFKDQSAVYQSYLPSNEACPDANGIEYWTFRLDNMASGAALSYAISYEVGGSTYWDNNGGANYSYKMPDTSDFIVYEKLFDANNCDLYLMDASGLTTQLTDTPQTVESQPSVSADGKKIAYIVKVIDFNSSLSQIWMMDIDGTHQTKVSAVDGNYSYPVFSPDASKILYVNSNDGSPDYRGNKIQVCNTDGTGITDLTDGSNWSSQPVWSPDGTKIAFKQNVSNYTAVYVMNADGTGAKEITSGNIFNKVFFNKTGDGIYVVQQKTISLFQLTDSSVSTFVNTPSFIWNWGIISDYSRIIYEGDSKKIYTINIDGSNQQLLATINDLISFSAGRKSN